MKLILGLIAVGFFAYSQSSPPLGSGTVSKSEGEAQPIAIAPQPESPTTATIPNANPMPLPSLTIDPPTVVAPPTIETNKGTNPNIFLAVVLAGFAVTTLVEDNNKSLAGPSYDCVEAPLPVKAPVENVVEKIKVDGKVKENPKSTAFASDENPNKKDILSQGCIQDLEIVEKCFAPLAEKLKSGKVTIDELKKSTLHEGFRFKSHNKDIAQARSWEFHHEKRARQDVSLSVMDGYHFGKGSVYGSEMMFFPRKQVPDYVTKDNGIQVTLANGETVNFDSKSGVIKSGVLTENKPIKGSKPEINYQGDGVMIKMTGLDGGGKSFIETATDAFIFKKGFPPCKVPASDLWPKRKSGQANNFKFATDEGLDQWLKNSKCGFSL